MNKFGVVLGVAAVATLAGCKDPDYKYGSTPAVQNEVKTVETVEAKPVAVEKPVAAPENKAVVAPEKPVVTADLSKPAEPEYTVYVVQNGDYLAKISKKYNVTIASIRRLNPSIKKDVICVGQKLKLPGKIDVAAAPAAVKSAAPAAAKKASKKSFAPYTGATKEYVVKNGDTLGSVAYGNGLNIRQLKELNGLTSDTLKIGQKLKVPAAKVEKAAAAKVEKKAEVAAPAEAPKAAPAPAEVQKAEAAAPVAAPAEAPKAEEKAEPAAEVAKPVAPATTTYVVQEGDDMTGVSIRWGVSTAEIRELNNLSEKDQLVPGQIIKLPAEAQQ